MSTTALSATELARSTPADRDRYVDLLRAGSLGVVIVGHWLMAVVVTGPDGPAATNALALLPGLRPLTWVLQVMPVFFFVGGFSHAVALGSARGRGLGYAEFVRIRSARLLVPTVVFIGCWLSISVALELIGRDRGLAGLATRVVAQPLWFIGVYLGIVALAPFALRCHRSRYGTLVPLLLAVATALVDLLRFGFGVPSIGWLNTAFVWLAVHQLGFFYADRRLRTGAGIALTVGGLAGVVTLTAAGPYPVSMVGLPGERVSNMAPPTLALLCHAAWLVGVVVLLRRPARRLLERPRVWLAVVRANGIAMTAFLWHLTAMFLAGVVLLSIGLPDYPAGSAAWWLARLAWAGSAAGVTAGLVAVFRRADRPRSLQPRTGSNRRAGAGVLLSLVGVLGLSVAGFGGLLSGHTATLVVLPVTPASSAVLLAVGIALLELPVLGRARGAARRQRL